MVRGGFIFLLLRSETLLLVNADWHNRLDIDIPCDQEPALEEENRAETNKGCAEAKETGTQG